MKRSLALLLALLLLMTVLPLCASASTYMWVSTGNYAPLNVRSQPSASAAKIGELANGTRVLVLSYAGNNWALVQPDGWTTTAYVSTSYLTAKSPSSSDDSQTQTIVDNTFRFGNFRHVSHRTVYVKPYVTGSFINLRWGPSRAATVMTRLYANHPLIVVAEGNGWYQVIDEMNDYYGFIEAAATTTY